MQIAICTIMLQERPYLAEWLAFHAAQGVTHFRIYVDQSRPERADDGTMALLEELAPRYGIEAIAWTAPGPTRQMAAFAAGVTALRGRADWVAFVDVDEFVFNPHPLPEWLGGAMRGQTGSDPGHGPLAQWLSAMPLGVSAIAVQQRIFGSAGRLDMPSERVTTAYTLRASANYTEHLWYKSIVRPHRAEKFLNSHHAMLSCGQYVLGDGDEFTPAQPGQADRIAPEGLRMHHYILKSKSEFLAKQARGALSDGAVPGFQRMTDEYFSARDASANKVQDYTLAQMAFGELDAA